MPNPIGFKLPPPSGPIALGQRERYDANARTEQSQDPLWKRIFRDSLEVPPEMLKGLLGVDPDPLASNAGYAANALTSLGSAGEGLGPKSAVTMFGTKAARLAGTERFLNNARNNVSTYDPYVQKALEEFGTKYPRISAHMDWKDAESKGANAFAAVPTGKVKGPIETGMTSDGRKLIREQGSTIERENRAREMVFHEGNHVAQALGNSDMRPLYENIHDLTGYRNNPFETNSNFSGNKNTKEFFLRRPTKPRVNINEVLDSDSRRVLDHPHTQQFEKEAANNIQGILAKRGVIQSAYKPDSSFSSSMRTFLNDDERVASRISPGPISPDQKSLIADFYDRLSEAKKNPASRNRELLDNYDRSVANLTVK